MAGKKKNTNDEGLGKTARASALKKGGKQEGFIAAAPEHMDRIISLGGGEYLYLLDPRNGKTHHIRTGSNEYFTVLNDLFSTNHADRIRNELVRKGFPLEDAHVE